MQRERVTDDIYVFTSDLYAQVTAGVILTDEGAILVDTLAYPEETRQIKRFVEERLNCTVRYVVNTHFHADHTTGTYLFPGARVIAHQLCRKLLDERGRESLEELRSSSPDMREVALVLPDLVFDKQMTLYLGNKTLQFWSTPGHSDDSIVCYVKEDQVLFAADTIMPLPYFYDGDYDDFLITLEFLKPMTFEHIIQGHGEVILRGEVHEKIQSDITYLHKLRDLVDKTLANGKSLESVTLEKCGKSRILLNGTVQQLHLQNVRCLAERQLQYQEKGLFE